MQFDLFKIMDGRYVDDFRNGFLYMNNVRYFHNNFRDPIIGDIMEGEFVMRNKAALAGCDPEFLKHVPPTVMFEDENYASTHIFCMYAIQIDRNKQWVLRPDEKLLHFYNSEAKDAEMVAVRITDTKRFVRQVSACLRRLANIKTCDYAEMYVGDLHALTDVVSLESLVGHTSEFYQGHKMVSASMTPLTHHQSFGDPQSVRSRKIPGRAMVFFTGETFE